MVRRDRSTPGPAVILFLALLILPLSGWSVAAPAAGETENEPATEVTHENQGSHDLEFRHVASLFLGFTDEKGHDSEFTEGLEYAYRVAPPWSVGVIFEHAGGELRNALLVVPVYWFPHAGWFFLAGPGVEFHNGRDTIPPGRDDDEEFFIFKIGAGYEFELGRRYILAPTYNLDFVDGAKSSVWVECHMRFLFSARVVLTADYNATTSFA